MFVYISYRFLKVISLVLQCSFYKVKIVKITPYLRTSVNKCDGFMYCCSSKLSNRSNRWPGLMIRWTLIAIVMPMRDVSIAYMMMPIPSLPPIRPCIPVIPTNKGNVRFMDKQWWLDSGLFKNKSHLRKHA